jgi:hypothetical protein
VPCLPPGSMSRILDGKPAEMCELPHGSREIEAQIGVYLGRGCRRMRPEMTARSIQSWQKRKTRFSPGDYMRGNGGATPNEDNEHEAHSSNAVVGDGLRRRSNSRLCPGWWWARRIWRRIWPHGYRAKSFDALGSAGTGDAEFPKPDSVSARGPVASASHQWAVGAQPVRRRDVGAPALTRRRQPSASRQHSGCAARPKLGCSAIH